MLSCYVAHVLYPRQNVGCNALQNRFMFAFSSEAKYKIVSSIVQVATSGLGEWMLTPEMIAIRRTGIGGSDVAAVLGVHPYRSPLDVWLEKVFVPTDGRDHRTTVAIAPLSEAIRWGDLLEETIAQEYARRTGAQVFRPETGICRHPRKSWMLGNPDRLVVLAGKTFGLEVKTAGWRALARWGPPPEECPHEYILQCAWYMGVTGLERWDLAGLLCGQELRTYTFFRDLDLEEMAVAGCERFWKEHVLARVPPPIEGSESFKAYFAELYPTARVEPARPATAEEERAVSGLMDVDAHLGDLEREQLLLENQLKASLQDSPGIFGNDWSVSWKNSRNGLRPFRCSWRR